MTEINNVFNQNIAEHIKVLEKSSAVLSDLVQDVGVLLAKCILENGTIYWCGNGGSAADSQHLAAELVGRFNKNRRALRSIALTTDTSVLTCISNDFCYEDIFSRQIEALGRGGDILVSISTSGMSENILRAMKSANKRGMINVALLGKDGGDAKSLADFSIIVPSMSTARIQEIHILIGHVFCEIIEKEIGVG